MWSFCSTYKEGKISQTGEGKTSLRDLVRVYGQHIREAYYEQFKCEEYFRTCGKGKFKIFPVFKLH